MPASCDRRLRRLCAAWLGDDVATIDRVETSGFSGARVYRLVTREGAAWAVKSWGPADLARISWVHALVQHLGDAGIDEIPWVATRRGETVVIDDDGIAWELARWIDGVAVESPSLGQAAAATACLARIHVAAAAWPECPVRHQPAAAVRRRLDHAERLLANPWRLLLESPMTAGRAMAADVPARLARAVALFGAGDGARAIRRVASAPVPVVSGQAVLRDIWWEHVLFNLHGDRVAGVIDLHAAGIDTPATDLARLLGSWWPASSGEASAANRREAAISAYQAIRPITAMELRLVRWLDATGVVFGLDNWFRWLLAESRGFGQPGRVAQRIERLLERLPEALSELADGDGITI
ncbi:MAG: phosphotransferase enzyme family protein [Pirellulales bacterium]